MYEEYGEGRKDCFGEDADSNEEDNSGWDRSETFWFNSNSGMSILMRRTAVMEMEAMGATVMRMDWPLESEVWRNAVTLISFDYFGEQIWNSVTIPFSTFSAFLHYCIFSRSGVGLQFWWWAQLWVWCRRWACVHKVRCPCWICKTALIVIYCRSFDEDANRHGAAYARYSMVEHTHCPSAVHYVGDKIFSAEAIETISPKP